MTLDDLALYLGHQALAAYGLTLLVALAAMGLLWLTEGAARRRWAPWVGERPGRHLGVLVGAMAAGLLLIAAAAQGFAEVAEHIGPDGAVGRFDEQLTATLRDTVGPATLQAFAWASHAGDTLTLTLLGAVVAVLLWSRRQRLLACGWVLGLAGNGVLTRWLKSIFERVRPEHSHELTTVTGWSFPSGHSSGGVVAYGLLAYLALRCLPRAWQLPALLAAAAIAVTIGWSRIFLQVHYASDVLAGWLSGGAWLAACVIALEASRRARARLRRGAAGPQAVNG